MVDRKDRAPRRCGVTGLTRVRRLDVFGVFAGCVHAVVAAGAVPGDGRMVEGRG